MSGAVLISVIVFIVCMIIFLVNEIEFYPAISMSGFVCFIVFSLSFWLISEIKNNTQSCKEESQLIVPTVSYANDSSFKTLKFEHEKIERKIRIQKSDSLFNWNDSIYIIEPCEETVLKRSR